MPPITKLWLCTLKEGKSLTDPALTQLLADILTLCTSYTNPNTLSPMHAFYQVTNDPSHLFMITGYQCQELNTEADKAYAEKYLPRLFEYVRHQWLRQVEVDVREMPLDGDAVVCCSGPGSDSDSHCNSVEGGGKGVGGWDVWKMTQQGKQAGVVQGVRGSEPVGERIWVQVSPWEGSERVGEEHETFYLRKIMSR
ncbi:hypothetical protein BDV25DRAFT_141877 [Aspergillus avenaceus]|uniref:Uncharacterized protein n=1 Tax=Aspergillus avenaceus TaxID=36643 RepID=A0A5N6TPU7_ASPAV|nr:hypothetical protein BDV25DRAFT_141877 [Aspergillus avenaceus]